MSEKQTPFSAVETQYIGNGLFESDNDGVERIDRGDICYVITAAQLAKIAQLREALKSSLIEHCNVESILQHKIADGEQVFIWLETTQEKIEQARAALAE